MQCQQHHGGNHFAVYECMESTSCACDVHDVVFQLYLSYAGVTATMETTSQLEKTKET